jgi:hypothetical protein
MLLSLMELWLFILSSIVATHAAASCSFRLKLAVQITNARLQPTTTRETDEHGEIQIPLSTKNEYYLPARMQHGFGACCPTRDSWTAALSV